jgi:HTH-type transcriptional regulator/antitoxin HigA
MKDKRMADIHPIRTEVDYERALAEIADLVEKDPAVETPEGERLELLSLVVKDYEEKYYTIPAPDDPVEVIWFYMEKDGLTRKDLEAYLGNKARVSDILSRRRSLSLTMIRRLNQGLGIPADLLLSPGKRVSQGRSGGAQVFPNP